MKMDLEALRTHLNEQNCPSVDAIVVLVRSILSHYYFIFFSKIWYCHEYTHGTSIHEFIHETAGTRIS